LVEEQNKTVDKVLGKHCKFMEFATNSPPVQNAVASGSMPEKPVEFSLQHCLSPAPAFKFMKEYDEHEKKHRNRTKKAKSAKKDSVHLAPVEGVVTTNVQVFPEVSLNPISESGELLFLEENLKVFPNSPSIINPKHPHAKYFKAFIESLNLDDDEGYLNDPSLDMNHHTDKLSQVEYKESLDWDTPSAQDNESSDEDSIRNELAAMAGLSQLSLTSAPSRRLSHAPSSRSSKSKGKQREDRHFRGDDQDNNLDSHAYDNHGYNRLVSTNFTLCTLTKDKKLQLLSSLSSLESRVELFCNKCSSILSKCVKCKTQNTQDKIEIMADSGASECFTHTQSDLSEFEVSDNNELVVKTASKTNSLKIKGKGAWIIMHEVTHRGKKQSITSCLYPVYYLPGLTHRLMSVSHLLNNGLELRGSSLLFKFSAKTGTVRKHSIQSDNRSHMEALPSVTLSDNRSHLKPLPSATSSGNRSHLEPFPSATSSDNRSCLKPLPSVTSSDNRSHLEPLLSATSFDNWSRLELFPSATSSGNRSCLKPLPSVCPYIPPHHHW
jgi:hypothetical protein